MTNLWRKQMPHMLSPVMASAVAGLVLLSSTVRARESVANLGTLTCTIGAAPDNPGADVKLSCNFKPTSGAPRDYEGIATRQGVADFPRGKHVIVWSVIGPGSGEAPALSGMFRGETGGTKASALIGGENGSVRLEPVTGTSQVDAPAALTVLTLNLAPTRA
jgi:hypothetical protein